jgi:hypothetical protein
VSTDTRTVAVYLPTIVVVAALCILTLARVV